jgi:hypothetical protein
MLKNHSHIKSLINKMASKIKCTCGHSWDKSDSSKKDATVCHICGKDNVMKNGGWLENYAEGGQADVGFNYNGAWGGQFEDGGHVPQAQFGIFGKKNNQLDCPKWGGCGNSEGRGLHLGEFFGNVGQGVGKLFHREPKVEKSKKSKKSNDVTDNEQPEYSSVGNFFPSGPEYIHGGLEQNFVPNYKTSNDFFSTPTQSTTPMYDDSIVSNYASPETNYIGNDLGAVNNMRSTAAMGASIPGSVGFMYARTNSPAPSEGPYAKKTKASAENGTEMSYYQHGLDWKPKSISKNGSVIKDDNGYWNPDNRGKVVEIDSPTITMEGVDQDLIGISDEGDVQYMTPGKDYKFKGEKVREYPVGKNGVNQQDEKVIEQLDQLTNFTNYNKPTKGGWLDKYN